MSKPGNHGNNKDIDKDIDNNKKSTDRKVHEEREKREEGVDNRADSSIFYIMDGIIDQLNKTKKLFIIMILTIMIIPPIAFTLTFMFFGFPFHDTTTTGGETRELMNNNPNHNPWKNNETFPNSSFRFLPIIPVIVVVVWLGIGIRQWFVLSKWDKKYKRYKELQRQIDEKLEKD